MTSFRSARCRNTCMRRCWVEAVMLAPPPITTTTVAVTTRQKQPPWQRNESSSFVMTRWGVSGKHLRGEPLYIMFYLIKVPVASRSGIFFLLLLHLYESCFLPPASVIFSSFPISLSMLPYRCWTPTWTCELFNTSSGATPPRTLCCFTDRSSEADPAVLGCHSSCAVSQIELAADNFDHKKYCYILLYKRKDFFF